jgi:hypothetical protein
VVVPLSMPVQQQAAFEGVEEGDVVQGWVEQRLMPLRIAATWGSFLPTQTGQESPPTLVHFAATQARWKAELFAADKVVEFLDLGNHMCSEDQSSWDHSLHVCKWAQ